MSEDIDKNSCWYDTDKTPSEMIRGATGVLWPVLEKSDHFSALESMLRTASISSLSILDVGCGAGDVSRVCGTLFYVGADMPHILSSVSQQVNPLARYREFDAYESNYEFIGEYDIVLMNAFIDVIEYPVSILRRILENSKKYVILHRQTISSNSPTKIVKSQSYGGWTYRTVLEEKEFKQILQENEFQILEDYVIRSHAGTEDIEKSFLLKKRA